jgi:flagellar FliL protein
MADEENENTETAAAAPAKKPAAASQKNPLVAVLLILNMIAMGTVAFFQYKFMEMEKNRPDLTQILKESGIDPVVKDESAVAVEVSKESLVDLATFTVNLAQGDGPRRYVRLNAVLKMSTESQLTEVEARKPQIRDTVISILNSKRPEDILKRDGKLYLKEQIKSAINSFLIDGKVIDVFYIGFQIN